MIKYKVKVCSVSRPINNRVEQEQKVMLVQRIKVDDNTIDIPHPVSGYIQGMSNTVNGQKQIAYSIRLFFNYIQEEIYEGNDDFINLSSEGLYGLNLIHLSSFLNYLGDEKGCSYKTVKLRENMLLKFYYSLMRQGLIDVDLEVQEVTHFKRPRLSIVYPFTTPETHINYPNTKNNSSTKLKDMDVDTWMFFIEVAQRHEPMMAFPLYTQFMGGLRMGEVVNLTTDAIAFDKASNQMYLDIEDRQKILFPDRFTILASSQVKCPRANQVILNPFGDLIPLYHQHLSLVTELKSKNKSTHPRTLLLNKNGDPMSGENYMYRFNKLKKIFLTELSSRSPSTHKDLSSPTRWGTHIGRGVFTNFIITQGLCDLPNGQILERYVASLRGDKTTHAALAYIDQFTIRHNIEIATQTLHTRLQTSISLKR